MIFFYSFYTLSVFLGCGVGFSSYLVLKILCLRSFKVVFLSVFFTIYLFTYPKVRQPAFLYSQPWLVGQPLTCIEFSRFGPDHYYPLSIPSWRRIAFEITVDDIFLVFCSPFFLSLMFFRHIVTLVFVCAPINLLRWVFHTNFSWWSFTEVSLSLLESSQYSGRSK